MNFNLFLAENDWKQQTLRPSKTKDSKLAAWDDPTLAHDDGVVPKDNPVVKVLILACEISTQPYANLVVSSKNFLMCIKN